MQKQVRTIGLVLETREDALRTGAPLDHLYHWREPGEIEAIRTAIQDLGFDVTLLGTPESLIRSPRRLKPDVDFILNLSVGFTTRFRLALGPSVYELLHIPYSGADPFSKLISQNKQILKSFLNTIGIPTPPWAFLNTEEDLEKASLPDFPVILKPAHEGSSIGIGPDSVVPDKEALRHKAGLLFRKLGMPLIAEQFIRGREYKVGMIGNREPKFFGLLEDTRADGSALGSDYLFFDAKKTGAYGKACRDIRLPEFDFIRKDCTRLWRLFLPLDYCTFDIRADEEGNHFFLEFNADATLHPLRTLARCCNLNEISFGDMIALILESAFERWGLAWK